MKDNQKVYFEELGGGLWVRVIVKLGVLFLRILLALQSSPVLCVLSHSVLSDAMLPHAL